VWIDSEKNSPGGRESVTYSPLNRVISRGGGCWADVGRDRAEGAVSVLADRGDCSDADDDDQSQHNGVFNSGRAVFTLEEGNEFLAQVAHLKDPLKKLCKYNQVSFK
jgi:hypothetical protein